MTFINDISFRKVVSISIHFYARSPIFIKIHRQDRMHKENKLQERGVVYHFEACEKIFIRSSLHVALTAREK